MLNHVVTQFEDFDFESKRRVQGKGRYAITFLGQTSRSIQVAEVRLKTILVVFFGAITLRAKSRWDSETIGSKTKLF